MKVMVIVKATEESEAGVMPSSERFKEMGDFNEQLVKAGIMLAGEGLHPTSKGYRVRFSGKDRTVTQGPFAETHELIAGYWIWNVRSMEEAIEWVKKCPNPMTTDSVIEIRRIFEAEDFGEVFNQEMREQEAAMKATLLGLHLIGFQDGKELQLVGINRPYTAESRSQIPKQWGEFVPWIGRIAGQVGKTTYGVSWNCKPGCEFDYLTAVEVDSSSKTDESLTSLLVPATRYAVFAHRENVSLFSTTIDKIWSSWVPECGLKVSSAPSIERYTEEFDAKGGNGGMELWIPLEG